MGTVAGAVYGALVVGYFSGMARSGWRLWRFREPWSFSLTTAAMLALLAGWPTGGRVQSQLRNGERAPATLVNPGTRPLLVAFGVVLVPFMALLFVPDAGWKPWVAVPLGLAGLLLACATWLRDRPEALPHPA